ncbi:MAG: SLC13 family permease [Brevundimonas sp.]|jgi:solute carrier family 13 (sodium-dependent dicarboxylate transporter), member 2/3/5|uniref:SLC13 family permease n=1 Tax=Brevundimonas sp. TaxID=1871086 RepID=UPI00391CE4B3
MSMMPALTSRQIGLIVGVVLAVGLQLLPVPEGLDRRAWLLASLMLLMASWWATEAIPIAATALVPLALFPLLGIVSVREASLPYADPIVMLLLGGFIIALSIERWNLHARIALHVVLRFGARPALLVLGFMVAAAGLSMWISNTATCLMMLPIALKVAESMKDEGVDTRMFAPALALAIAYAASIGGLGTPVGTPSNLIGIGYLENTLGRTISFPQWMMIGLPAVLLIIPAAWLILTRLAFRVESTASAGASGQAAVRSALAALGTMSTPEKRAAALFATVAVLWMGRELNFGGEASYGWNPMLAWLGAALDLPVRIALNDTQIAVAGALATFLVPAGGRTEDGQRRRVALMDWDATRRLPWAVIILFGGGISMAGAMTATGLDQWLGAQLSFVAGLPTPLVVLIIAFMVVFLTELTSNVATATAFMPVLGALAIAMGVPVEHLIVPVALAASCAFMLPVATAPNAIVYGGGSVTMAEMIRAGFRINLVAAPLIALVSSLIAPLVFPG